MTPRRAILAGWPCIRAWIPRGYLRAKYPLGIRQWIHAERAECSPLVPGRWFLGGEVSSIQGIQRWGKCRCELGALRAGTLGRMRLFPICFLLALPLAFASCETAKYEPPQAAVKTADNWSRTIDKPFEVVWPALIEHAAASFFSIDNFEKDSGLLTLSFGSSNIKEFVTGGHWEFNRPADLGVPAIKFNGDYAEFLELYQGGALEGKMNIIVQDKGESTQVQVRARYVVSSPPNSWAFDTGGCATVAVHNPVRGTPPTRTICTTHKAEKQILDAIEAISTASE